MVLVGKKITKQLAYKAFGVLLVGSLVVGGLVYVGLVWREKQQFAQAEKEMDALYTQIVQKVGKPNQEKKERSCGYASRELGRGPRSCSIARYFLYEGRSADESNEIVKDILSISGGTYLQSFGDKSVNSFVHMGNYRTDQRLDQDFRDTIGLVCNLGYIFPVLEVPGNTFKPTTAENLQISITCSASAMAEYFPVKN